MQQNPTSYTRQFTKTKVLDIFIIHNSNTAAWDIVLSQTIPAKEEVLPSGWLASRSYGAKCASGERGDQPSGRNTLFLQIGLKKFNAFNDITDLKSLTTLSTFLVCYSFYLNFWFSLILKIWFFKFCLIKEPFILCVWVDQ